MTEAKACSIRARETQLVFGRLGLKLQDAPCAISKESGDSDRVSEFGRQ